MEEDEKVVIDSEEEPQNDSEDERADDEGFSNMQFLSYNIIGKKGEGTFSQVLKAQSTKTSKFVAIKCMKSVFDSIEQVNRLREIQALRRLSPHPNIIKLLEVLYDQGTGKLALVFELMDMNIYELIGTRKKSLPEEKIRNYMFQLLKAMEHMHRNGIFHRDIKPENILLLNDGNQLKLADFGSCRGIYSKQPFTEYISTRWYRAPECLLTDGFYNMKMDMWGVGCVFFEIVTLYPLFPGNNEVDQIHKIHNIMGTPSPDLLSKFRKHASSHINFNFPKKNGTGLAKLLPNVGPECLDLMQRLLTYNPDERITAAQAIKHPYFKEIREAEKRQRARQRSLAKLMDEDKSSCIDVGLPTIKNPSSWSAKKKKNSNSSSSSVSSHGVEKSNSPYGRNRDSIDETVSNSSISLPSVYKMDNSKTNAGPTNGINAALNPTLKPKKTKNSEGSQEISTHMNGKQVYNAHHLKYPNIGVVHSMSYTKRVVPTK